MEINTISRVEDSQAPYYTRKNLEVILGTNRRTLDYRLGTLVKRNALLRLKPGFYLNLRLLKAAKEPEVLLAYIGCQAVPQSYLSLEYALSFYGILAESVFVLTFITTQKPRMFAGGAIRFRYRNIKRELFFGYVEKSYMNFTYRIATPAKAVFDFFYLTPFPSKAALRETVMNARMNWGVLTPADKAEINNTVRRSQSKKMIAVLSMFTETGVL